MVITYLTYPLLMCILCAIQSMNCVRTNFKQNMVITETKPSQRLGAAPPAPPRIWDLLLGIGTLPENFFPTPLIIEFEKDLHQGCS